MSTAGEDYGLALLCETIRDRYPELFAEIMAQVKARERGEPDPYPDAKDVRMTMDGVVRVDP